jgi:hypothetical protein
MAVISWARAAAVALAGAAAVWCGGCNSDGLSPRESTNGYADTVYQGQAGPTSPPTTRADAAPPTTEPVGTADVRVLPPFTARGPISVAVVQIGEVAPPASAVGAFERRSDLFARVDALAGRGGRDTAGNTDDLTVYRQGAASLGDDYLLVCGGTLDRSQVSTVLSVFDLTIVGAFVVPSEQVTVKGRAAASLIDVRTGRLAFDVTAEAKASTLQPAATASGVGDPLADAVRQQLQDQLVPLVEGRLSAAMGRAAR